MISSELRDIFVSVGSALLLPPEVLAAIAWRESCFGRTLDARGFGDNGNGYGIMQVDRRAHQIMGGPASVEHVTQAATILRDMLNIVSREHPDWSKADRLRGAVAAYNAGPGNVRTLERMDIGTTGNNYSADVLVKAAIVRPRFAAAGA
jgi:soluble lytic murein transglycosylase-like protein